MIVVITQLLGGVGMFLFAMNTIIPFKEICPYIYKWIIKVVI